MDVLTLYYIHAYLVQGFLRAPICETYIVFLILYGRVKVSFVMITIKLIYWLKNLFYAFFSFVWCIWLAMGSTTMEKMNCVRLFHIHYQDCDSFRMPRAGSSGWAVWIDVYYYRHRVYKCIYVCTHVSIDYVSINYVYCCMTVIVIFLIERT